MIEIGHKLLPIEVKASQTFIPEFTKGIDNLQKTKIDLHSKPIIVTGGNLLQDRTGYSVLPWYGLATSLVERGII